MRLEDRASEGKIHTPVSSLPSGHIDRSSAPLKSRDPSFSAVPASNKLQVVFLANLDINIRTRMRRNCYRFVCEMIHVTPYRDFLVLLANAAHCEGSSLGLRPARSKEETLDTGVGFHL